MKLNKAYKIVSKRNIEITKTLKVSNYKTLEQKFSKILNIPTKVIFFENCQILSKDWNFQKKKYNQFISETYSNI